MGSGREEVSPVQSQLHSTLPVQSQLHCNSPVQSLDSTGRDLHRCEAARTFAAVCGGSTAQGSMHVSLRPLTERGGNCGPAVQVRVLIESTLLSIFENRRKVRYFTIVLYEFTEWRERLGHHPDFHARQHLFCPERVRRAFTTVRWPARSFQ